MEFNHVNFGVLILQSILASLEFFNHLGDEELHSLACNVRIFDFNPKEILFYEGDVKSRLYYLLSGEIKFYKVDRFDNEIFLYYLECNSMISDTTHIGNFIQRPCFANTEFTKKSQVLAFDDSYFFNLMSRDFAISSYFFKEVCRRIEQLEKVIKRDVVHDGTAKVAHMIVNDTKRFNSLKKHEIAYELHMQPETLSRILKKMVRNDLIFVDKGSMVIRKIEGLKEIYEIGE